MSQPPTLKAGKGAILLNRVKTFLSKPYNVILLLFGLVVTVSTIAPIVAILKDTFTIQIGRAHV